MLRGLELRCVYEDCIEFFDTADLLLTEEMLISLLRVVVRSNFLPLCLSDRPGILSQHLAYGLGHAYVNKGISSSVRIDKVDPFQFLVPRVSNVAIDGAAVAVSGGSLSAISSGGAPALPQQTTAVVKKLHTKLKVLNTHPVVRAILAAFTFTEVLRSFALHVEQIGRRRCTRIRRPKVLLKSLLLR